jgi:hypothetical protein
MVADAGCCADSSAPLNAINDHVNNHFIPQVSSWNRSSVDIRTTWDCTGMKPSGQ